MSLTKQRCARNPDDFPTGQLFLLGESPPPQHRCWDPRVTYTDGFWCSHRPPGRARSAHLHLPLRLGPRQALRGRQRGGCLVLLGPPHLVVRAGRGADGHALGRPLGPRRQEAGAAPGVLRHHAQSRHGRVRVEHLDCAHRTGAGRAAEWEYRGRADHGWRACYQAGA